MRKVIGIGETVLDILFRNGQPVSALPGGSTYNAVISMARAGLPVTFIGEVGHDRVGDEIVGFLEKNGVDTRSVCRFQNTKSPISLAFLNEQNDAEYVFYKDHPHDRLDLIIPDIGADDIVLFGSYYAVNPVIRMQVKALLDAARSCGAIIYYDVNFRAAHAHEAKKLAPCFRENLEYADLVRGSHEDFAVLFQKEGADAVYDAEISSFCRHFIYTQGSRAVEVRGAGGFAKSYPVAEQATVSTVGAGDNFNAGFIYGLMKYGVTRSDLVRGLSENQWDALVGCACRFSAECCKDIYNYVSESFGHSLRQDGAHFGKDSDGMGEK